jgi:sugar lactone lactonase YvrE
VVRPAALLVALTCASALAQQPRIDSVSPAQGPIAGGTIVTVKGSGLGAAAVKLGTAALTPLSQRDDEIRLQMPRHDNGYAVISARNAGGSAYGEFLYVPPRLDELPPGSITTVAGIGTYARDFGPAVNATVRPSGLAYDKAGNLYIADTGYDKVTRVRPDGTIERVTGVNGIVPGDGLPAVEASVIFPLAVAVDPAGNVYIPDHRYYIRKVDAATGLISTIAGDGTQGFSGDGGPAVNAKIGLPTHIAADGDDLFFVDFDAHRVRRIHFADGTISTFAGNGTAGFSGDGGPATAASFNLGDSDEGHLALDPAGNLYIADTINFRIRRIDRKSGVITTFYVLPQSGATPDGVLGVRSLAFDSAGNAYYGGSGRIVKLDAAGHFVKSWGNGTYGLPIEGASALASGLGHVVGLAIDGSGNVVFSDDAIGRVRRIDLADDTLHTVAGIGPATVGENGPPIAALLQPTDIAFDLQGRLLIAEPLRLRRLEADGNLATIGGTGSFIGTFAPAPAKNVVIAPASIEIDRDGNVEMADLSVVDRIDRAGTLRWIVGHDATCALTGDGGPAAQATLCQAWDATRDRDGNLLIADTNNNRVRRVDAKSGIITTIVGNGGPVNGYEGYNHGRSCGDGGKAIDACLNTPYGIELDDAGDLFIAEGGTIRKVEAATGTINTFALGFTSKMLFSRGYLYAKYGPIVRYDRAGVQTTVAGHAGDSVSNDVPIEDGGPALAANIPPAGQADGFAIDAEGNLFFTASNRVRAVRYGAVLAPAGATISAAANGSTINVTVRDASDNLAPSVRVDFTAPATGATCTFSSAFAITDANGTAAVSCTPNCVAGAYGVTARPLTASSTATVPRTNSGACKPRAVRH